MVEETPPAESERKLKLLSLDGGGIRGLSSLYLLKQLMETLDPDYPPKPCNFFDMIGGTSTGGLVVLILHILSVAQPDPTA
jgi:patatin-like phospholipase/acyl hydrolase